MASSKSERGLVIATRGLEELALEEVRPLATSVARVLGGARYEGAEGLHQELNLRLRIASRVYRSLGTCAPNEEALRAMPVAKLLRGAPGTVRVEARGNTARLAASAAHAWGLQRGEAHEVLVLEENGLFDVLVDTSGEHLHKRGYRQEISRAPLRETLAAALLAFSRYDGDEPLVDPMCGSGTLVIEGALISLRRAPGLERPFGFEEMGGFDAKAFAALKERVRAEARPAAGTLRGSDLNAGSLGVARRNARRAGVFEKISLNREDATVAKAPLQGPGLVVANLPFGERVGDKLTLPALYRGFGAALKKSYPGFRVALLLADPKLLHQFPYAVEKELQVDNGGLDCTLALLR